MPDMSSRYYSLAHAVQTGVMYKMGFEPNDGTAETSPKHLRVGVNMAMISASGLAKLMIDKGIITFEEYEATLIQLLESEVEMYEKWLSEKTGSKVELK